MSIEKRIISKVCMPNIKFFKLLFPNFMEKVHVVNRQTDKYDIDPLIFRKTTFCFFFKIIYKD